MWRVSVTSKLTSSCHLRWPTFLCLAAGSILTVTHLILCELLLHSNRPLEQDPSKKNDEPTICVTIPAYRISDADVYRHWFLEGEEEGKEINCSEFRFPQYEYHPFHTLHLYLVSGYHHDIDSTVNSSHKALWPSIRHFYLFMDVIPMKVSLLVCCFDFCLILFFETLSYCARPALNSKFFFASVLSASTTGVFYHAQLQKCFVYSFTSRCPWLFYCEIQRIIMLHLHSDFCFKKLSFSYIFSNFLRTKSKMLKFKDNLPNLNTSLLSPKSGFFVANTDFCIVDSCFWWLLELLSLCVV